MGLGLNPGQQEEEARRESKRGMKGERKIRIHPQYLLISPLLPPLANFLSLSVGLPSSITSTLENFTSSVSSFFRPRNDAPSPPPPPPLPPPPTKHNLLSLSDSPFTNPGPPTLIIHGTTDIFTPLHKYRVWKEKWLEPPQALQGPQTPQASQSRIGKRSRQVIEVPTAGHFWIEEGVRDMLVGEVRGWLGREGDGGDEDEGIEGVWVYL